MQVGAACTDICLEGQLSLAEKIIGKVSRALVAYTREGGKVLHDLMWAVGSIIPTEIEKCVARGEAPPENSRLDAVEALNEIPFASHPLIRKYGGFYLDNLANSVVAGVPARIVKQWG